MAAKVGRYMRQKLASDAAHERGWADQRKQDAADFVTVPFEWQDAQTALAVRFPSFGWVPKSAIRWLHKDTGQALPWVAGRQGDTFQLAKRFAEARGAIAEQEAR